MGLPLRPFKHVPKSPTSVLDAPLPPVFTTHEELHHKGMKRTTSLHPQIGNKVGPAVVVAGGNTATTTTTINNGNDSNRPATTTTTTKTTTKTSYSSTGGATAAIAGRSRNSTSPINGRIVSPPKPSQSKHTATTVAAAAAANTIPLTRHSHMNGTSSTSLWLAATSKKAPSTAKNSITGTAPSAGLSSSTGSGASARKSSSSPPATSVLQASSSNHSKNIGGGGIGSNLSGGTNHSATSYYEEEVLDDDDESFEEVEIVMDNNNLRGGGGQNTTTKGGLFNGNDSTDDDALNLFPDRDPTIRFDEYDEMQTVLHINDYTKHEIHRSWYKREDYDRMVQLARKTAEKAEQRRKELEDDDHRRKQQRSREEEDDEDDDHGRNGENKKPGNHQNGRGARGRPALLSFGSYRSHRSGSHRSFSNNDDDASTGPPQPVGSARTKSIMRGGDDKDMVSSGNDKMKKPIEYRGLEAWTSSGAAKVKILKESAIELVWNEQSRQWDAGLFDPEAIRDVYLHASQTAQQAAWERGRSDALIVDRLRELEEAEAEKKRRRKLLGKSKALFTKSVKLTSKGVKQTGRLVQKTTKVTTKVAKEATKRGVKAGVATATLDPRMMKEALKVSMKKRECKHEVIRKPSQSHIIEELDHDADEGITDHSNRSLSDQQHPHDHHQQQDHPFDMSDQSMSTSFDHPENNGTTTKVNYDGTFDGGNNISNKDENHNDINNSPTKTKNKKSKLKLLGVVPIPGTKKVYKEDRREKKAEKRIQKQARRPAWEANVSTGKY